MATTEMKARMRAYSTKVWPFLFFELFEGKLILGEDAFVMKRSQKVDFIKIFTETVLKSYFFSSRAGLLSTRREAACRARLRKVSCAWAGSWPGGQTARV